MKFIELPECGNLINIDRILSLEHEVIGDRTKAVVFFSSAEKMYLSGKDADYLIEVLKDAYSRN